jgi:hypothetical protein
VSQVSQYHIKIAAEAFAAGLLAHAGYDVLIQYGADQPVYDLVVGKSRRLARVSVKGTQLPGWTLAAGYVRDADYHRAADEWLQAQCDGLLFFFVSFYEVPLGRCPDSFVATAPEVAQHLKSQRGGQGHGALSLRRQRIRGAGAGTTDTIPEAWRFSLERMDRLVGV